MTAHPTAEHVANHTADAEALARVQAYLAAIGAYADLLDSERIDHAATAGGVHRLTTEDLRRVVAMADQIGDAR